MPKYVTDPHRSSGGKVVRAVLAGIAIIFISFAVVVVKGCLDAKEEYDRNHPQTQQPLRP